MRFESYIHDRNLRYPIESSIMQHDSYNSGPCFFYSFAYYLSYEEVLALADDGITQGYVTLEELDEVARSNYHPDTLWDIWVKTPEMIAEMDTEERKQYGHIAFVDYNSTGYICRQLINAVDPYEYGIDRKELVFIVRIC